MTSARKPGQLDAGEPPIQPTRHEAVGDRGCSCGCNFVNSLTRDNHLGICGATDYIRGDFGTEPEEFICRLQKGHAPPHLVRFPGDRYSSAYEYRWADKPWWDE